MQIAPGKNIMLPTSLSVSSYICQQTAVHWSIRRGAENTGREVAGLGNVTRKSRPV